MRQLRKKLEQLCRSIGIQPVPLLAFERGRTHSHKHAHTHGERCLVYIRSLRQADTHARTHAHTHARTHTHMYKRRMTAGGAGEGTAPTAQETRAALPLHRGPDRAFAGVREVEVCEQVGGGCGGLAAG